MDCYVARHAILDRNQSLFAYELLFRSWRNGGPNAGNDTETTLQLLANSLLSSGLEGISGNVPLFINFGRELLTSDWTRLFPPSSVVIEILETVQPDAQVFESCVKLRQLGYLLALDDVVGSPRDEMLLCVANFVKVDFRATSKDEQLRLAKMLKPLGKRLLAEKVETHEEFMWAYEAGYDLFQGFFFAKPTLLRGRHLPSSKVGGLQLLKELQCPDLSFKRVEDIVKCDAALTYKLFRYVNSALFHRQTETSSVKEALMLLGELGIRRWMTLATLPGLAAGSSRELLVHALVRARFCELMAETLCASEAPEAFLVGLFSLLDALMDRDITGILSELSLPERIMGPLINPKDGSLVGHIYRAVVAYETADWINAETELGTALMSQSRMREAYLASIAWSTEVYSGAGVPAHAHSDVLAEVKKEDRFLQSLLAMQNAQTQLTEKTEKIAIRS